MLRLLTFLLLTLTLQSCGSADLAEPVFLVTEDAPKAESKEPPIVMTAKAAPTQKKNQKKVYEAPEQNEEKNETSTTENEASLAREILLATISTDYTDRTYDLVLSIDDNNLVSAIKTKSNKGKIKNYPLAVLNREIVLVKAVGVSLVTLKCDNFSQTRGCPIEIEYPSNLTYGKFLRFEAELARHDEEWRLESRGRAFRSMHLIAKKMFGLLIGVERIELR